VSISNRIDGRNIVAVYTKLPRLHEQQFANDTPPILQFWKGIECSQIILDDEHRDSGHFHVMTSQHWAGHIGAGNFTWIGL